MEENLVSKGMRWINFSTRLNLTRKVVESPEELFKVLDHFSLEIRSFTKNLYVGIVKNKRAMKNVCTAVGKFSRNS